MITVIKSNNSTSAYSFKQFNQNFENYKFNRKTRFSILIPVKILIQ